MAEKRKTKAAAYYDALRKMPSPTQEMIDAGAKEALSIYRDGSFVASLAAKRIFKKMLAAAPTETSQ